MVFFGYPSDGDGDYCGHILEYLEYFSVVNEPRHKDETWFLKDSALYDDGDTRYFIVCPD